MRSGVAIHDWINRNARHDVDLEAVALRADGTSLPVKLRNISYDGCLLEAEVVLSIGEKVVLSLPRMGEVKSQIRWATMDGKAGARFLAEEIRRDSVPGTDL